MIIMLVGGWWNFYSGRPEERKKFIHNIFKRSDHAIGEIGKSTNLTLTFSKNKIPKQT